MRSKSFIIYAAVNSSTTKKTEKKRKKKKCETAQRGLRKRLAVDEVHMHVSEASHDAEQSRLGRKS